jgi:methylamine utilization protein MauE
MRESREFRRVSADSSRARALAARHLRDRGRVDRHESAVAAATLALFLGFAALSLWAARRGLRIACSCFGRSDRELGKDTLVTSLMLAGATLAYWVLLGRTDESLSLGELPLAAGLGVAAVLGGRWLLVARELAGIVRQRRVLDKELEAPAEAAAR